MNRVVGWACNKVSDSMTGELLILQCKKSPPWPVVALAFFIVGVYGLYYSIMEKLGVTIE